MIYLTPWFEDQAPVHVGVYRVDIQDAPRTTTYARFSYWDGGNWHEIAYNQFAALDMYIRCGGCYRGKVVRWRGLCCA